ncbi:hypothetical protein [Nonomuraea candida]|uniref:hypothetical protein n=1 Tax=Nonomuraea candida TaxID=359159 RepID=UPI000694A97E|nr:hypothetical protein [Nonomuraea candida]
MDVRAEILDLKLRVEDLETNAEQAGGLERQEALLREIVDRSKRLQAEVASLKAQLSRARAEIGEEFAAVGTEVEGVRREVAARPAGFPPAVTPDRERVDAVDVRAEIAVEFGVIRSELQQEFSFLRSEIMDLGIKLDRLLIAGP